MKKPSIIFVLALAACTASPDRAVDLGVDEQALESVNDAGDVAPPDLVVNGDYSDVRFLDMMAAHHRHAIEMANIAADKAQEPALREMASMMAAKQAEEIEELRKRKASLTTSSDLPTKMHPKSMEHAGIPMPLELEHGTSVDAAFLDSMVPHHAGAIEMSNVVLRRSNDGRIVSLARTIIDDQAKEIGEMIAMRNERFAGLNHGFPHQGAMP